MINLCRKPLINTSAGLFSARPSQNVVGKIEWALNHFSCCYIRTNLVCAAWPSQQLMRSWRTRRIDLPSNGARGLGKDTVGTWIDLASFVSSSGSGHSPYEELADKIGEARDPNTTWDHQPLHAVNANIRKPAKDRITVTVNALVSTSTPLTCAASFVTMVGSGKLPNF